MLKTLLTCLFLTLLFLIPQPSFAQERCIPDCPSGTSPGSQDQCYSSDDPRPLAPVGVTCRQPNHTPSDPNADDLDNCTCDPVPTGKATCPSGTKARCSVGNIRSLPGDTCYPEGSRSLTNTVDPVACVPDDGSPEWDPRTGDPVTSTPLPPIPSCTSGSTLACPTGTTRVGSTSYCKTNPNDPNEDVVAMECAAPTSAGCPTGQIKDCPPGTQRYNVIGGIQFCKAKFDDPTETPVTTVCIDPSSTTPAAPAGATGPACVRGCQSGYTPDLVANECVYTSFAGMKYKQKFIPVCEDPKMFASESDIAKLDVCVCTAVSPTSKDKDIAGCTGTDPSDPKYCPDSLGVRCNLADGTIIPISKGVKVPAGTGIMTAAGCVPTEPQALIESFLKYGIMASGGIALIIMLIAALQMITAEGNPELIKQAQERFYSAIIGLLLVIFAVLLVQFIGFNILGLPDFNT